MMEGVLTDYQPKSDRRWSQSPACLSGPLGKISHTDTVRELPFRFRWPSVDNRKWPSAILVCHWRQRAKVLWYRGSVPTTEKVNGLSGRYFLS